MTPGMSDMTVKSEPAVAFDPDAAPLADLPARLADAGFESERVEHTLSRARVHGDLDRPYLHELLAEPTAYNTMVRLFVLCEPVPADAAATALGDLVERLARVGLLRSGNGQVQATARLTHWRDLLLVTDILPPGGGPFPADYVMGVARTADILARLTPRARIASALDIGTGCGIHALAAARHAGLAVGTDISERALTFARLNAHINGIDNVEWRKGSFFAPVADSRFDLIVSNPPFAISPGSTYIYRDGVSGGSSVSGQVVSGAADHLAPGGFAVSLVSWYHALDEDFSVMPRTWVEGSGCDAWLLHGHSVAPLEYAAFFLRQTELYDQAHYAQLLDRWVRYYEENGMERLAIGTIVLRRRSSGTPWFRAETVPSERITGDCGDHVQTIFRNEDLLHGLSDERRLLDLRLRIRPRHYLEHRLHLEEGEWAADRTTLALTGGIATAGQVDAPVVQLIQECSSSRTFGEAVASLARAMGVETTSIVPRAIQTARQFLQSGLLEWDDGDAVA